MSRRRRTSPGWAPPDASTDHRVSVPLPPRWVRRLLLQPIFWLASVCVLVVGLPFLLVVMALLSFALPAKLRALRLLGFAIVYLTLEVVALALAFGSWLASGFGWALRRPAFVEFHYRVVTGPPAGPALARIAVLRPERRPPRSGPAG